MKQKVSKDKRYTVGAPAGRWGYAPTLAKAKTLGRKLAKLEAWKGKWNVMYICLSISRAESIGYYSKPILNMYIPVRGSGVRAERILAEIKRRHGVKPFVWTRK